MPVTFKRIIIKIPALTLVIGLSVGCATNGSLEQVRAEAQRAMITANDAKATSDSAERTANQALQTADEAKTMSMETDEKVDRMFRRAMYK